MHHPLSLIRRFAIRTRMPGAIVLVLALFALVGATGLVGSRHLVALNTDFTEHAIPALRPVNAVQRHLGATRRHGPDMAIHGVAVLKPRLAQDAGSSLGDIAPAITLAGAGQSQAIGHVNGARTALDAVTQQNATLAEQGPAAAARLNPAAARIGVPPRDKAIA